MQGGYGPGGKDEELRAVQREVRWLASRLATHTAIDNIDLLVTHTYIQMHYQHLIALGTAARGAGDQDAELREIGAVSCELFETKLAQRWRH